MTPNDRHRSDDIRTGTAGADSLDEHNESCGVRGLVSVIIPCYQQARFLPEAIDSVLRQTYGAIEIIVLDDGSTDDTKRVATSYDTVRYVTQANGGVSKARNTGFLVSRGEYLVFLDADDRLLPHAIETGISSLAEKPGCALTFGSFFMIDAEGNRRSVSYQLYSMMYGYRDLLQSNCIGNPGVVLYRRWALTAVGGFDPLNGPAGDYDLYLRIAQSFPITCHHQAILEYRRHDSNMSNDPGVMLKACLSALAKQREHINGDRSFRKALEQGRLHWQQYYGEPLVCKLQDHLSHRHWTKAVRCFFLLLAYYPERFTLGISRKIAKLWELSR